MDFPALFMGAGSIDNLCLLPAGKMEEEGTLTLKRGDGSAKIPKISVNISEDGENRNGMTVV